MAACSAQSIWDEGALSGCTFSMSSLSSEQPTQHAAAAPAAAGVCTSCRRRRDTSAFCPLTGAPHGSPTPHHGWGTAVPPGAPPPGVVRRTPPPQPHRRHTPHDAARLSPGACRSRRRLTPATPMPPHAHAAPSPPPAWQAQPLPRRAPQQADSLTSSRATPRHDVLRTPSPVTRRTIPSLTTSAHHAAAALPHRLPPGLDNPASRHTGRRDPTPCLLLGYESAADPNHTLHAAMDAVTELQTAHGSESSSGLLGPSQPPYTAAAHPPQAVADAAGGLLLLPVAPPPSELHHCPVSEVQRGVPDQTGLQPRGMIPSGLAANADGGGVMGGRYGAGGRFAAPDPVLPDGASSSCLSQVSYSPEQGDGAFPLGAAPVSLHAAELGGTEHSLRPCDTSHDSDASLEDYLLRLRHAADAVERALWLET